RVLLPILRGRLVYTQAGCVGPPGPPARRHTRHRRLAIVAAAPARAAGPPAPGPTAADYDRDRIARGLRVLPGGGLVRAAGPARGGAAAGACGPGRDRRDRPSDKRLADAAQRGAGGSAGGRTGHGSRAGPGQAAAAAAAPGIAGQRRAGAAVPAP